MREWIDRLEDDHTWLKESNCTMLIQFVTPALTFVASR